MHSKNVWIYWRRSHHLFNAHKQDFILLGQEKFHENLWENYNFDLVFVKYIENSILLAHTQYLRKYYYESLSVLCIDKYTIITFLLIDLPYYSIDFANHSVFIPFKCISTLYCQNIIISKTLSIIILILHCYYRL